MPFSRPDVVILSDGDENRLEGSQPDRFFENVFRAELHSFRVNQPCGQAMVYAGGGYTKLFYDKEGVEVAGWLNGLGFDAHVLVHRLPGSATADGGVHRKDIALADGLAALDHLADASLDLPLFHVGLSSGGHLAGVMACQQHRLTARGAVIAYAPLNANHRQHKFPSGKPDYAPVEKQDFYDDWPIGLAGHPQARPKMPVFLAYALNDRAVPVQHALRLVEAAAEEGFAVDAHVFAGAPHGFALRDRSGTHVAWAALAHDWMQRLT